MKFKEAVAAAKRQEPVMHKGIEYERIIEVGMSYRKAGEPLAVCTLLDQSGHSVTIAEVNRVYGKCRICGKWITGEGCDGEPVTEGVVCEDCFPRFVLPKRVRKQQAEAEREVS